MLQLCNITKEYRLDSEISVHALRGVSIEFGRSEFVSILGPSGCGKTTLLNIIGGLDRYTTGELLVDGQSTSDFADSDWDAYRNRMIGFVFQTYNLIPHLSVLQNVEIALTIGGVDTNERRQRATKALVDVGLADQLNKRPNQLSGGQMQRVAIARALVNNPQIILADEPTGALDSVTSLQIMDLLKQISQNRLVIMVTHNHELAEQYCDRIVKLCDGKIIEDSKPTHQEVTIDQASKLSLSKTSMSFVTALGLSLRNLLTKKGRTVLTSIAGSIGIIGIALVLALSSGMSSFVDTMQTDVLAGFPLTVSQTAMRADRGLGMNRNQQQSATEFPDEQEIYSHDSAAAVAEHTNIITNEYLDYLAQMDAKLYNSISYSYGIQMHAIFQTSDGKYLEQTIGSESSGSSGVLGGGGGGSLFSELPTSRDFVESQYDLLGDSAYPTGAGQAVLIVDNYNRIDVRILEAFGIDVLDSYGFDQLIGRQFRVATNNDYYVLNSSIFERADLATIYASSDSVVIEIVGIMRLKSTATSQLLTQGIAYTADLTALILADAMNSDVVVAQRAAGDTVNVLSGMSFGTSVTYQDVMRALGGDDTPIGIAIYPVSFDAKESIKAYLDAYNAGRPEEEQIIYADLAETITQMISTVIDTIAVVLTAVAAISLLVSSLMIGIITYVSVVERTKEIGILRSVGARKRDISRVFTAESVIIGFVAGVIGVVATYLLSIPINLVIGQMIGVDTLAALPILSALAMIAISTGCTWVSGLFPARIAARRDPVNALRNE